jgi:hypothetical protein
MTPVQEEKIYQLWKDLDAFKKQLEMTEGKPEYAPRRRSPPLASCAAHSRTARRVSHPPRVWGAARAGEDVVSASSQHAPHRRGIVLPERAHARALHEQQRLTITISLPIHAAIDSPSTPQSSAPVVIHRGDVRLRRQEV